MARNKGKLLDESIEMFVGTRIYDGWKSASVNDSLTAIASSFSVEIMDKFLQDKTPWLIKPGSIIKLRLAGEFVSSGAVDSANINFGPASRVITLAGRSRAGDLVDSSFVSDKNEFTNVTLEELITEMVKQYSFNQIDVVNNVSGLEPFAKFTVKIGETVFEAIDRAARQRGVLLTANGAGDVVITRRGSRRSSTILEEGQNIKLANATFDDSERFSEYIVKGQSSGLDEYFGKNANEAEGRATDAGVARYRPLILIDESDTNGQTAEERAKFEATMRAAKAMRISGTVQGWRQNDGSLWKKNEIVRFKSSFIGVNQRLLIESVRYNKGPNGTTCQLTMIRENAFELKKEIPEDDDPLKELGII